MVEVALWGGGGGGRGGERDKAHASGRMGVRFFFFTSPPSPHPHLFKRPRKPFQHVGQTAVRGGHDRVDDGFDGVGLWEGGEKRKKEVGLPRKNRFCDPTPVAPPPIERGTRMVSPPSGEARGACAGGVSTTRPPTQHTRKKGVLARCVITPPQRAHTVAWDRL